MFVWFSSDRGGSRMGCCGVSLFLLPLSFLTVFTGFGGNNGWLLLLILAVVAALFVLPRFMGASSSTDKRKNDENYDENEFYDEKPKRDDDFNDSRYVLTDDGEIVEAPNEDVKR